MDSDATAAPAASAPAPSAATETVASSASGAGEKVVVPVPIMGESITTGTLADWSVSVGDAVDADQVVAVIDTDKVAVLSV